jgi:bacterioferritin-associated ferredoxin
MIICSCNVFSDTQVRAAIVASTERPRMSQLYSSLGCTAQCGRCARTIKAILDDSGCRPGSACCKARQSIN